MAVNQRVPSRPTAASWGNRSVAGRSHSVIETESAAEAKGTRAISNSPEVKWLSSPSWFPPSRHWPHAGRERKAPIAHQKKRGVGAFAGRWRNLPPGKYAVHCREFIVVHVFRNVAANRFGVHNNPIKIDQLYAPIFLTINISSLHQNGTNAAITTQARSKGRSNLRHRTT